MKLYSIDCPTHGILQIYGDGTESCPRCEGEAENSKAIPVPKSNRLRIGGRESDREMIDQERCRFYFIQYWAFRNPEVLTYDDIREAVYKIWVRIWDGTPKYSEGWLKRIGDEFENTVRHGSCKTDDICYGTGG